MLNLDPEAEHRPDAGLATSWPRPIGLPSAVGDYRPWSSRSGRAPAPEPPSQGALRGRHDAAEGACYAAVWVTRHGPWHQPERRSSPGSRQLPGAGGALGWRARGYFSGGCDAAPSGRSSAPDMPSGWPSPMPAPDGRRGERYPAGRRSLTRISSMLGSSKYCWSGPWQWWPVRGKQGREDRFVRCGGPQRPRQAAGGRW